MLSKFTNINICSVYIYANCNVKCRLLTPDCFIFFIQMFKLLFCVTEKDITNNEPLENTELAPVPDENMTDLEEIER